MFSGSMITKNVCFFIRRDYFFPVSYNGFSHVCASTGYVLSREALTRLITKGISKENDPKCRLDDAGSEDLEMGICMEKLNVTAGDSR